MQLDVARDLAAENFATVDPVQAAGDFNLDNYKFTPPSAEELEAADGKNRKKLGELEKRDYPEQRKSPNRRVGQYAGRCGIRGQSCQHNDRSGEWKR